MEEQGLAQQQAMTQQEDMGESLVEEVIKLLQQGVPPEELIKMGVPQEVVEAAISAVKNSMQMPTQNQGLAQTMGGI